MYHKIFYIKQEKKICIQKKSYKIFRKFEEKHDAFKNLISANNMKKICQICSVCAALNIIYIFVVVLNSN